jgi:hypothetical protein
MKIFRSARRGSLRAVISSTRGAIDLASIMTGVLVLGIIGGVIAATVFAVIPWSQDNAAKGNLATVGTAERAVQTTGATIFLKYDSASTDHLALEASRLGGIQHPNQRLIVDTNAYGTQYLAAQLSQTGQVWLSTSEDPTPRAAVDAGFVLASYTGGPGTTVSALAIPDSLLVPAGIASAAPQAMIHALVTRTRYFAVPGITPSELTVSTFSGSMNTATVDYGGPVVQAVQDAGYADLVGLHIRLAVDAGTVDGINFVSHWRQRLRLDLPGNQRCREYPLLRLRPRGDAGTGPRQRRKAALRFSNEFRSRFACPGRIYAAASDRRADPCHRRRGEHDHVQPRRDPAVRFLSERDHLLARSHPTERNKKNAHSIRPPPRPRRDSPTERQAVVRHPLEALRAPADRDYALCRPCRPCWPDRAAAKRRGGDRLSCRP